MTESSWIVPVVVGLSALMIGVGKGGLGVAFGALATPLVWVLPLAPIGVWIGRAFVLRAEKELYERVILLFLVVSALLVLLT